MTSLHPSFLRDVKAKKAARSQNNTRDKTQTHDSNSMTRKLPINIDHLLRQRSHRRRTHRVQDGLESAERSAHHLRLRQRLPQPGRGLRGPGGRGTKWPPDSAAQGQSRPDAIDAIQKRTAQSGALPPYSRITIPLTATYNVDGRTILVLWVPGGETRPYKAKLNLSAEGAAGLGLFHPQDTAARFARRGQDERELLSLAATVPFDDRYRQTASLDDLSHRLIQ